MKKRLAIWGWWQGQNLGDRWIKRTLASLFPGASFINTQMHDFSAYGFVICGGGGLFAERTIPPWADYSQDTPYGILGLGSEFPHSTDHAKRLSKNAKFFCVRDQYSLDCMKIDDIERSYDITFASPLSVTQSENLNLDKLFFVWRHPGSLLSRPQFKKYICYENNAEEYNRIVAEEFAEIKADNFQTTQSDIENRIADCGFVISGRYHGIVAAIQKGLPCIAIDICPKLRILMRDCGLEEYCIKVNEVDKLSELIKKAKGESEAIRQRQLAYRERAHVTLLRHLSFARAEIDKAINPLKVLYYGSYYAGVNDVVKAMADDLCKTCDAKVIDPKIYTSRPDKRVKSKKRMVSGQICTLDTEKIKKDIEDFKPDAVVLNSGGLVLEDSGFELLSEMGIASVGIELSDPDLYRFNGAQYAHKFDLFYTNSKHSFTRQYDREKVNIRLLPFAASLAHHFYMPEVEKKFDLAIVANPRGDRLRTIKKLKERFHISAHGKGMNEVHGLALTKAINEGKMYLSFAKTAAGFHNVKVGIFEAMACNQVVITKYMDELNDYFKIGEEILCYQTDDELLQLIQYYLEHEEEREAIRKRAYLRFLKEHTYLHRWMTVKQDIMAVLADKRGT